MVRAPADDALLAGYGTGDPQAAASFIRRHQSRVYGLAVSIVTDPTLAEDVAQEAFTRAWRHAATYDPLRGTVPTWLLTITRNLAIDALRLRRSIPVDPATLSDLDLRATGVESEPGRAAELADNATRLRVALAELPQRPASGPGTGRLVRANRPRGQRERGDTARHGQDQDPHRHAQVASPPRGGSRNAGDRAVRAMTDTGCDAFGEIAPELALGLLSGNERGAAITHLATCARCQAHLEGLVRVADHLLLLTPPVEPEIGFESRVMGRLAAGGAFRTPADAAMVPHSGATAAAAAAAGAFRTPAEAAPHSTEAAAAAAGPPLEAVPPAAIAEPPPSRLRPRRPRQPWARPGMVAAAAALIVVAGMTGVLAGQSQGRNEGRDSAVRQQAQAANQLAARTVVIRADDGASTCQLVAFPRSATEPARLVIHLDQPKEPAGSYDVLADPADGGNAVAIGTIEMVGGHGWLMASIPSGTGPVGAVRIIEASKTVRYRATFEPV